MRQGSSVLLAPPGLGPSPGPRTEAEQWASLLPFSAGEPGKLGWVSWSPLSRHPTERARRAGARAAGLLGLLPEEVIFAVELALAREALLREVGLALAALNAFDVPRAVQDVQQKAVEDGPLAAGTVHHHSPAPRAARAASPSLWGPTAPPLRSASSPPLSRPSPPGESGPDHDSAGQVLG